MPQFRSRPHSLSEIWAVVNRLRRPPVVTGRARILYRQECKWDMLIVRLTSPLLSLPRGSTTLTEEMDVSQLQEFIKGATAPVPTMPCAASETMNAFPHRSNHHGHGHEPDDDPRNDAAGRACPQIDGPYNYLQIRTIIAFAIMYSFGSRSRYITIMVSYGVGLAYFVTKLDLFRHGWGKHMWDAVLPNTICYLICPAISKLAILSVLYRINPALIYRIAVAAAALFIFAYTLTLCIITGEVRARMGIVVVKPERHVLLGPV
ncbi:hypothetical protein BDW66DRAFT_152752 [Aspergillus desertorum]